jgi:hypothetical protein
MSTVLRIIGIFSSLMGTLLLAWRAKHLIDSLEKAHYIAESNFRVIKDFIDKKPQEFPYTIGSNVFVDDFKPLGKFLFFLGFLLLIIGNFLIGLSWYVETIEV